MVSAYLQESLAVAFNVMAVVLSPSSFFWAITLVVGLQYYRMAKNKAEFFEVPRDRVWPMVLVATGWGIVAGIAGSLLMDFLNISIGFTGLEYLWPVALVLMMLNPRFLCFAYAGGLVSLSYLIFGWPQVNPSQMMALVGVLHLMESFLILVSGHLGATPTYMKLDSGEVVGAFTLQRLWPIPLSILILSRPIILDKFTMELSFTEPYFPFLLVIAALGYSDIALSRNPKAKSSSSFKYLGLYSIILLAISIFSAHYPPLVWIAVLFGPLGHELVIKLGQQEEFGGRPIYRAPDRGVMVLDVVDKSAADVGGIRSEDVILTVDGIAVDNKQVLEQMLRDRVGAEAVEMVIGRNGSFSRSIRLRLGDQGAGIIPVPDLNEGYYVELLKENWILRWVRRSWGRLWGRKSA